MKSIIVLGCLTILLGITVCLPGSDENQPAPTGGTSTDTSSEKHPIPFPDGYDFPSDPKTLQGMIDERDEDGVRAHGWNLWAGINQPGSDGWPIWRSWYITTQVFAPPSESRAKLPTDAQGSPVSGASVKSLGVSNSTEPIDYRIPIYTIPADIRKKYEKQLGGLPNASTIPDGENFQNNGDLMLVSEAFTTEAYQFIREQNLYTKAELSSLKQAGNNDIPDLPARSMVLKHMYWPVKKDGLTALPLWDDPPSIGSYTGFEIQSQWKRAVAIDPNRKMIPPGETAEVTFLYGVQTSSGTEPLGPNTYKNANVVSIEDFYYKQISRSDFAKLSLYDQILLDLSFYWTHDRPFEEGDYLVSVASHIITKEIPQWTLQSVWWHDRPDEGPYSKNRPEIPQAKGPWKHYLLTSEYGIPLASDPRELPVVYNPYIELASHPIRTNCRNCHIRAAWENSSYLKLPVPPNPDVTANIQTDNEIFNELMRTDFLWTIPDRAINEHP